MRTSRWTLLAVMAAFPMWAGQGCPAVLPSASLTHDEEHAVDSAAEAAAALSQATALLQAPAEDDSAGQGGGSVTVGTCPAITTSLAVDAQEGVAATLSVNFGSSPCSPAAMPGRTCSGAATGSINSTSRTLVLNIQSLSCGQDVLSGSAEASFSFWQAGVNIQGSFDLEWTGSDHSVAVSGQGAAGFDRGARVSTIGQFNGSLTDDSGTYTASFADVVVSYLGNEHLIPSGGVVTVTGPNIRTLTIRFSETSPATGEIEVSINNGAFRTVNLFEL